MGHYPIRNVIKIKLFFIKGVKELINYKFELLINAKIYLISNIFY